MSDTMLTTATVKQIDDFTERYTEMKPRKYPTATLLQLAQGKKPISEKVQWGEQESFPLSSQVNYAAGYSDSATAIAVDDNTGWQIGTDLLVHRTKEIITVLTLSSTTGIATCTRGARSTSAAALVDNDVLIPMSVPRAENYTYSDVIPRMTQASDIYNYVELWAEGCAISNSEQVFMANGGKAYQQDEEDQILRAIENIKASANKAALWGIRSKSSLTRTAGGILQFAGYKDVTSKDLTDRTTWEKYMGEGLKYGEDDVLCACSWTALQAHNRVLQGASPANNSGEIVKVSGVEVQKMRHFMGGWIYLYYEPALVDDETGGNKLGICMTWVKGRMKQHTARPIGRYKVPPTTDGQTTQVQLEASFSFNGAKHFTVIGGIVAP